MTGDAKDFARQGIAALRAGDRPTAYALLGEAARLLPHNANVLLWLSDAAENEAEQQHLLEQVLQIAPASPTAQIARKKLDLLDMAIPRYPDDDTDLADVEISQAPPLQSGLMVWVIGTVAVVVLLLSVGLALLLLGPNEVAQQPSVLTESGASPNLVNLPPVSLPSPTPSAASPIPTPDLIPPPTLTPTSLPTAVPTVPLPTPTQAQLLPPDVAAAPSTPSTALADQAIAAFRAANLDVGQARPLTANEYPQAPPDCVPESRSFAMPSFSASINAPVSGIVFVCQDRPSVEALQATYATVPGERVGAGPSAAANVWLFAKDNLLLQLDGRLPEEAARQYETIVNRLPTSGSPTAPQEPPTIDPLSSPPQPTAPGPANPSPSATPLPSPTSSPTPGAAQPPGPGYPAPGSGQLPPEVIAYIERTEPHIEAFVGALVQLQGLASAPQFDDPAWATSVTNAIKTLRNREALLADTRQVPPDMAPLHNILLDGVRQCADTASLIEDGITNEERAPIDEAALLLNECVEQVDQARQLLRDVGP